MQVNNINNNINKKMYESSYAYRAIVPIKVWNKKGKYLYVRKHFSVRLSTKWVGRTLECSINSSSVVPIRDIGASV